MLSALNQSYKVYDEKGNFIDTFNSYSEVEYFVRSSDYIFVRCVGEIDNISNNVFKNELN